MQVIVTLFHYLPFYFQPFQGFDQDSQESDQWCSVQHFQAGASTETQHFDLFTGIGFDNNDIDQDPREEVMTLERVLLQTIKFDLQVSRFTCRDLF